MVGVREGEAAWQKLELAWRVWGDLRMMAPGPACLLRGARWMVSALGLETIYRSALTWDSFRGVGN